MGLLGAVSRVYVFYRNVLPVPPSPLTTLPYYFVAFLVVGIAAFLVLKARKPEVAERAGTFADDAPVAGQSLDFPSASAVKGPCWTVVLVP